jgi:hypothetical protein
VKKYGKEIIGNKYGRLTVTKLLPSQNLETMVEYSCECGGDGVAPAWRIVCGVRKSCGCIKRDAMVKRNTKHGLAHLPEYKIWAGIKTRCLNLEHSSSKGYGDAGVTISKEWEASFTEFFKDMGSRPTPDHSVERVKNSLGYSKDNCVWATANTQQRNRSSTLWIEHKGETKTLKEWADSVNLDYHAAYYRFTKGWSIDRMLSTRSRAKKRTLTFTKKGTDMKICDVFAFGEFEDLLSEAESNAVSGWDMSFVEDMDEKFKQYGSDMFVSDSQLKQLRRIAGDE